MAELPPAPCQEGRPIEVLFDFPPQLRIEGDLKTTTVLVVRTALAFAVALFPEFQKFAAELAEEDVELSAWDTRTQEVFTKMKREHLYQFFSAVTL